MMQAAASGRLVAERYALISPLGSSDLSEVYAAFDHRDGRPCAVKLLYAKFARYQQGLDAFREAASRAAQLRNSKIVAVTDFGLDVSTGRPFAVTEHVELPSLSTLVGTRGALPLPLVGEALRVIGSALEAGISIRLSHGSLKPENVFLSPERPSVAKLSDFGISKLRCVCPPPHGPAPLGWSSPAALEGAPPDLLGDVFSLGLTTFYALVGRHYLRAMWQSRPERPQVLRELLDARPVASEHARAMGVDLPAALDEWFARALSSSPRHRFANASEAVRAFAEGSSSLRRLSQKAPSSSSGILRAIAAPLVFQDLPRAASAHDGVVPQAPALFGGANSTSTGPSQPSPSDGQHEDPEHVAGLPSRPPLAPLAAIGLGFVGFVGLVALSAWGISRLFKASDPASSTTSALTSDRRAPIKPPPASSAIGSPLKSRAKPATP